MKRAPLIALALGLLMLGGVFVVLRGTTPDEPTVAQQPDDNPNLRDGKQLIPGRWRKARNTHTAPELTPEQQEKIEQLESIGYVSGSQAPRTSKSLTVYDPARAYSGLNLYTSGHFPGALLTDMEGTVLHRWELSFQAVWGDAGETLEQFDTLKDFWRRVHLFPNGDLLVIFEGVGIFKVDKESRLLWAVRNGAHHDLAVLPTGDIYVLTRTAHVLPRIHPTEPILEDFITLLDSEGNLKQSTSLIECLENSDHAEILKSPNLGTGDIFHTNSLFLVDGAFADRVPWLRAGTILTSLRNVHALAVVDPQSASADHAWSGAFRMQHDPKVLANGNILLFDNQGARGGKSRVVEFNPQTSKLAWFYAGTDSEPLDSPTLGTAERLPNGNTLITESDFGRAVEVAPDKTVVWEFYNPNRVKGGEYIATIFEMIRLPEDFPIDWANAP